HDIATYVHHSVSFIYQALLSFPTRRSSDLTSFSGRWQVIGPKPPKPLSGTCACHAFCWPSVSGPGCPSAVWHCRPTERVASARPDRKSTRLNSSHVSISYAVFCLKKKKVK